MITEKITRFKFFVCVSIILATIMGVYAQDIAYYIVGNSPNTTQIYLNLLTILTVLSVGLFVVTPIGIYIFIKKTSVDDLILNLCLIADIAIGALTSVFSIFVMAMSWGQVKNFIAKQSRRNLLLFLSNGRSGWDMSEVNFIFLLFLYSVGWR